MSDSHSTEVSDTVPSELTEKVFYFASQLPRLPNRAKPQETPKDAALDATRQSHLRSDTQLTPWVTRPITFRYYDMADPKKQEKDYTKEVDALLPETKTLAEVNGNI